MNSLWVEHDESHEGINWRFYLHMWMLPASTMNAFHSNVTIAWIWTSHTWAPFECASEAEFVQLTAIHKLVHFTWISPPGSRCCLRVCKINRWDEVWPLCSNSFIFHLHPRRCLRCGSSLEEKQLTISFKRDRTRRLNCTEEFSKAFLVENI